MEFAIARKVLADELGKLSNVIAKKSPVPILGSIFIESTEDHGIKLTATNMESTIFSHISGNLLAVTQPGKMCVPAGRIIDWVRLASDGPIKISSDDSGWIQCTAKRSNFRTGGMDPQMWPDLPSYEEAEWVNIPASHLKAMIPGTKYAITKEEGRLNLRGAKLEIDGQDIRMVTTDGHRISLASGTLDVPMGTFEVMIPVEGVDELTKLLADYSEEVGISLSPNGLFFKVGQRILSTRLLSTKFPGYQMPFSALGTYPTFLTTPADSLAQAVKRALLCAKADSDGKRGTKAAVALNFESNELGMNTLSVSASDADLGSANEILDSNFNGGDLRIYCNGRFLLDFLEPQGSGTIRFEIKDGKSQMYLISESEGISFYYCLMPMRDPEAESR